MTAESGDVARILLDTTVLIDALRGRPVSRRIRRMRRGGDLLFTTAVNVEEVFRGALPGEAAQLRHLFNGLRVAPLGRDEGRQAGTWRRAFAAAGTTLSQADCLIAAAASALGATVATGNPRHFPMTEVTVEHWPVGR